MNFLPLITQGSVSTALRWGRGWGCLWIFLWGLISSSQSLLNLGITWGGVSVGRYVPWPGIKQTTQIHALSRNRTRDSLIYGRLLQVTEPYQPGHLGRFQSSCLRAVPHHNLWRWGTGISIFHLPRWFPHSAKPENQWIKWNHICRCSTNVPSFYPSNNSGSMSPLYDYVNGNGKAFGNQIIHHCTHHDSLYKSNASQ